MSDQMTVSDREQPASEGGQAARVWPIPAATGAADPAASAQDGEGSRPETRDPGLPAPGATGEGVSGPRKLTTAELVAAKPSLEEFRTWPRFPIYVVADHVRSLANVGLLFRLCDAVRAERLYLTGITGYPSLGPADPRPPLIVERAQRSIEKTAIRTIDYQPWEYREDATEVIHELRQRGVQIVALEQTTASLPYTDVTYQLPVCLVLGHERAGVESRLLELADLVVEIPMYGMGNSLNVAMAFGIIAYELVRRCRGATTNGPCAGEPFSGG